ncbi:hypothetical protein TUM19329_09250 [Legionella antarctica]|uniref:Uncharacterized protein n=1 Tax=Legionella antarctica TaxID=2708020 RepID=A0A6F8T1K3_9GAMM|nr:hypothetical protein [Legionella antarctica]BCA94564.1 hypothetical protein TUM19329_09250 [Legionella antarctica]
MKEYTYREFKINYDIKPEKNYLNLYKAYGYAECLRNKQSNNPKINFATEFPTMDGAQEEIKKIIKDYIDFEWDQFYKIKDEFPKQN